MKSECDHLKESIKEMEKQVLSNKQEIEKYQNAVKECDDRIHQKVYQFYLCMKNVESGSRDGRLST